MYGRRRTHSTQEGYSDVLIAFVTLTAWRRIWRPPRTPRYKINLIAR